MTCQDIQGNNTCSGLTRRQDVVIVIMETLLIGAIDRCRGVVGGATLDLLTIGIHVH